MRNLPLSTDLLTDARGDMKHDRGIGSFGCAQDDRLPLEMTTLDREKRNGKNSECVFISMSGFPFLFSVKGESAWQVLRLRSLRMTIKGADGSTAAHHDKVVSIRQSTY